MRTLFREDLHNLGEQLTEMATLVSRAMDRGYRAFRTADVQLAEEVIAADARIDAMQVELDEKAIELLALQGPVASDLRMIVGALRMSASLERMGDLARHIAQLVRLRYPDPVAPDSLGEVYAQMAQHCQTIADHLVTLLDDREPEHIEAIVQVKEMLDELHAGVFVAIAQEDWDQPAATTADSTLASRYFERFGDHGVSVAKKVEYLITGEWDARGRA